MNENTLPIVEPTIDYTKVPPIHQKRTVSFINHFVVNTVSFLNKFALSCEEKLYEFENKLQKIEAALVILESRLASVPGLENRTTETENAPVNLEIEKQETNTEEKKNTEDVEQKDDETVDEPDEVTEKNQSEVQSSDLQPINQHPVYVKYFKMVNFGVPKPAVKIKMTQKGLDPLLLDDPQKLIPRSAGEPEDS